MNSHIQKPAPRLGWIGIIILVLALCTVQTASAQLLKGNVSDAATGEPLVGATVFIPSIQIGAVADENGDFQLDLERTGSYRIIFRFVGYQSETQSVTLNSEEVVLNVKMEPTAVEAPEVTVTAKATASDILSTPQAVSVVTGRELAMSRGVTAFDAIEHVAGVRLLRTGVGITKPVIRGLTSQRVLVVSDGVRQEGQQWGDEHGPELDAFRADRIEVVKGPASLLYGSDALGGVIQTTSGNVFDFQQSLEGSLTLQALSNSRQGGTHLNLGGRTGRYAYEGALTVKRSGSYRTPDGIIPNTGIASFNGSVRLGHQFTGGSIVGDYEHFGTQIGLFEPDVDPSGTSRFDIAIPFQQVDHDRIKFSLDKRFSGNRFEVISAWQQNRRREFSDTRQDPELYLRLNTITTDARLHHRPVGPVFGTFGLSGMYQQNASLGPETLIPEGRIWNGAGYLYEEVNLPNLSLSGGLRADIRRLEVDANEDLDVTSQSRSYAALSGAAGLAWQPLHGTSVAFNVGRAWRAPVLIELFGNGVHEGTVRFERGDSNLNSEKSLSFDGTFRWLGEHFYVETSGYLNYIDDFIFPSPTGAVDPESGFHVYQYTQARSRLWGSEFKIDLHPHPLDWLHVSATGDVCLTRNLETDSPLPFTPPARLDLDTAVQRNRLGAARDLYLSVGPTIYARQNNIAPGEQPTDGYVLWNVEANGVLHAAGMTITPIFAVDNLFDVAYMDHLSRFRPLGILNPGRNVRLQIRFAF